MDDWPLLARVPEEETEVALIAWCRARLERIRDGRRSLAGLAEVEAVIRWLDQYRAWRRRHPEPPAAAAPPEGVWVERVERVSRRLAELAGGAAVGSEPAAAAPPPGWICAIEGTEIGRAATRYSAMRLADHHHGEARVWHSDAPQAIWCRRDGAWRARAPGTPRREP
jgi:hypothetical protein